MKKITKILAIIMVIGIIICSFAGCASLSRMGKSINSDFSGGLNRTVNVYAYNGDKIATYTGKIDIEESDYNNKVLFDLDGHRYVYYNATVEVVEN